MITGFNTDVKHKSKVFHVQTEDKGRNNPKIETLVYMGGEILDSYRTTYESDKKDMTEEEIIQLMESQHKKVIKSIKIGKYDSEEEFSEELVSDRSLDDIILHFLEKDQAVDPLKLEMLAKPEIVPGSPLTFRMVTKQSQSGTPIEMATIVIKLVSTVQKPQILAKGDTDKEGQYAATVFIPELGQGEHAVVVQAVSDQGTAEFRFSI
ncbi:MAG: hypothetical protein H6510_08990 [Acidobacteria bacterium]|nr:hypothetical protein [Acidobacteriota bacterium]MCB9397939.1 hypothetical protein [Acidobacteriota bacterium]